MAEASALSGLSVPPTRKAGPQSGGNPERPKPLLPQLQVAPDLVIGRYESPKRASSGITNCFSRPKGCFRAPRPFRCPGRPGSTTKPRILSHGVLTLAIVTVDLEPPRLETLSPSRAGDFKTCPQLFKFRAIERLPEPTSVYQARGTTAHLALQRLFDHPAADRTPELLFDLFRAAWTEMRGDEEFEALFPDTDDERQWGVESLELLANYFGIEDPTSFEPVDRELDMLEDLDGITIRGILDRIDRDIDGRLIITDYKTGKAPPERFALPAFFALKIYALLIRRRLNETPKELRLLYLNGPTMYRLEVDERQLDAMESQLRALWNAIERAMRSENFPPRPGTLCNWCSFQEICPAFSGDD